jgi:hypothetical protein
MLSAVAPGTRAAAMIFASRFVRPNYFQHAEHYFRSMFSGSNKC